MNPSFQRDITIILEYLRESSDYFYHRGNVWILNRFKLRYFDESILKLITFKNKKRLIIYLIDWRFHSSRHVLLRIDEMYRNEDIAHLLPSP